jgi:hypothetical protein
MGALSVPGMGGRKSAADLSGPRRRCIRFESATLSRCSYRHAANPWLTKKAGKQEAKEDDDERQVERHDPGQVAFDTGGLPDREPVLDSVREVTVRAGALSRGRPRLPPWLTNTPSCIIIRS